MSAFLVSDKHINTILSYANRHDVPLYTKQNNYDRQNIDDLQKLSQLLINENDKSVSERYNYTRQEPPIKFKFETTKFSENSAEAHAQIIRLCNCYDYQSCETDDYYQSAAHEIVGCIKNTATRNLIEAIDINDEIEWTV